MDYCKRLLRGMLLIGDLPLSLRSKLVVLHDFKWIEVTTGLLRSLSNVREPSTFPNVVKEFMDNLSPHVFIRGPMPDERKVGAVVRIRNIIPHNNTGGSHGRKSKPAKRHGNAVSYMSGASSVIEIEHKDVFNNGGTVNVPETDLLIHGKSDKTIIPEDVVKGDEPGGCIDTDH